MHSTALDLLEEENGVAGRCYCRFECGSQQP